jgi:hypothetical protein
VITYHRVRTLWLPNTPPLLCNEGRAKRCRSKKFLRNANATEQLRVSATCSTTCGCGGGAGGGAAANSLLLAARQAAVACRCRADAACNATDLR